MSDSTTPLQQIIAGANADVRVNEVTDALSPASLYGRRASTTTGLTWGYCGGRWGGASIANGVLALTASATNYIVVLRSSGAVSVSTVNTNWLDTTNYARCYLVVAGLATVTSYEDHRAGPSGACGMMPTNITGATLNAVNVFTRNQSVAAAALTSGVVVYTDASLSNNFKLTLGVNATLANPTNLTDGMVLNFRIKQDATGGRTLAYGTMFKFPKNLTPTLQTAANAVDYLSCYYDATDATLICNLISPTAYGDPLATVNSYSKNQSVVAATLTSGATIAVDASLSNNFKLTLGVNATLSNPTNLTDGMVLNFRIKQDATGGRTLAYGTAYKFPSGSVPVLSTAANAVDLMSCYYDATDGTLACNMNKAFA